MRLFEAVPIGVNEYTMISLGLQRGLPVYEVRSVGEDLLGGGFSGVKVPHRGPVLSKIKLYDTE